jgi:hypothetical protein
MKYKKFIRVIPSIALYILSLLLIAYAIWGFSYCANIISQAKAYGQLSSSGNEYDIVSFYMSNSGQYIVFALLLAAMGLLLQRKPPVLGAPVVSHRPLVSIISSDQKSKANDDELDEWFNEMRADDNIESEDS